MASLTSQPSTVEEWSMFAAQGSTQDPSSLSLVALVVITGAVVFWRTMIKVAAIGLMLLVVLGAFELLQNLH